MRPVLSLISSVFDSITKNSNDALENVIRLCEIDACILRQISTWRVEKKKKKKKSGKN